MKILHSAWLSVSLAAFAQMELQSTMERAYRLMIALQTHVSSLIESFDMVCFLLIQMSLLQQAVLLVMSTRTVALLAL